MKAGEEPARCAKPASPFRFLPLAVAAAVLALGYALGWHRYFSLAFLAEQREVLHGHVEANLALSVAAFLAIYTVAAACAFPAASVLTVFAGFLFGWLLGGVLVAMAATTGATLLFLAARTALGDLLRRKLGGNGAKLADGFAEDGFSYLLVLRLAPVFPFWMVNIAAAVFDVPLRTFLVATAVGILPGTFAYAWLGQGVGSVLDAARAAGAEPSVADLVTPEITLAFLLLALVAAVPVIVRKLRARRKT